MTTHHSAEPLRAAELTGRLEAQIQMRVDEIAASIPRPAKPDDTAKFLANVRNANAGTIRQAPGAAQRALEKTQKLDVGLGELVAIIEDDPTLTQSLLRYANSAYYATGGPAIVSLKQAAQRIGMSGVHNVVLGSMVGGMLCKPGGDYQRMLDLVHAHMVRTAGVARALARAFQVNPDEAFALGLLHDVGKLIVFDAIGNMRHQLRRDVNMPAGVAKRTLNAVHEAFGGFAALGWSLGIGVAQAIATHHRKPIPHESDRMSELLFIAERADHAMRGTRPMEVAMWWDQGALSGLPDATEAILANYRPDEHTL